MIEGGSVSWHQDDPVLTVTVPRGGEQSHSADKASVRLTLPQWVDVYFALVNDEKFIRHLNDLSSTSREGSE